MRLDILKELYLKANILFNCKIRNNIFFIYYFLIKFYKKNLFYFEKKIINFYIIQIKLHIKRL